MSKEEIEINKKRQICVLGDKENKWKKYLYLEDGVLVGERLVRIENGIEIPCEENGQNTYTVTLPPNFENEETLKLMNTITGETSQIEVIQHHQKVEFVKLYNETKNIGVINRLENGLHVGCQYFRIENNQEVVCAPPDGDGTFYFVPLPNGAPDFSSYNGEISIHDNEGKICQKVPKLIVASLDSQSEIAVQHDDESKINEMLEKISSLSDEDREKLKSSLENKEDTITTLEGKHLSKTPYSEIERAVDALLSSPQELVNQEFYKSINSLDEFGISRFVVDRFYHLPQLLSDPTLSRQPGTTTYILSSKTNDSRGNGICLEHRFQATSPEEATKLAKLIIKRLQGIQHKIWLGAWQLANELKKYKYTCALTELMRLCHPERNAYFQTKEKIEFYEHLKSLENTKIVFTRKRKKSLRSTTMVEDFIEIQALKTAEGTRKPDAKYPDLLSITVLDTAYLQNEKMAFVGAGYKHSTLELHADDTLFAQEIQTRKNQMQNAKNLTFDREYLIKLAGLVKTDKTKKTEANKLLIEKLQRLKDKGIIKDYPKRIKISISLKVR